jgi:hypothetical protein
MNLKVGDFILSHKKCLLIKIIKEKDDSYITNCLEMRKGWEGLELSFEANYEIGKDSYFVKGISRPDDYFFSILLEKEEGEKMWEKRMKVYNSFFERTIKIGKFYGKIG